MSITSPHVIGTRRIPCLVYSRVVGYLTPVQTWHDAKQQEFDERVEFEIGGLLDEKASVEETPGAA